MKKYKLVKKIMMTLVSLVLMMVAVFVIYASDYYKADEIAISYYENDQSLIIEHSSIIIPSKNQSSSAFIFYPGAKVEFSAYLPLLEKLNEETDRMVVLVKMPLNFAFLNINAADKIINQYPEIESWTIIGHSLGGAMASLYAEKHQDIMDGLIVLGAYVYGDYPIEKSLTIYGSLNTSVKEKLSYEENIVVIEGGNHALFGNYGFQKGDKMANITSEDQQQQTVDAIVNFIKN